MKCRIEKVKAEKFDILHFTLDTKTQNSALYAKH